MTEHENGDNKSRQNNDMIRTLAYFSQIGVTMGATVLIGVLIGKYLDDLFGTSPWLLLIFSLLGAGAALKSLFNVPKNKS
ncbi:AtpZ/AtpI family protein [Amphibacillus indicireducens]|uniref:AtpZ/AtpI family protein n=1 Tax=Amphibacillus indicireducens TaxID=1076330 RepID=A0ABP7VN57_9BACI